MILVCGEAIMDFTPAQCGGDEGFVPRPGGAPLNVAIGLARLSVPTHFFGRVSDDPFGQRLRTHLERNGVGVSLLLRGPEPTALAFVTVDESGDSEYVFRWDATADRNLRADDLPDGLAPDVVALHVGSLGTTFEPVATTLEALVDRERARRVVSFDPNVRPRLVADRGSYLERVDRLVAKSDLVKVSAEDLEWLRPGEPVEEVARDWFARGPALVVVTRAGEQAMGVAAGGEAATAPPPVDVVDDVGAGDAFMSGLLAWLAEEGRLDRAVIGDLDAGDLERGLEFAARVAAITCTRAGADPPRRAEL